MKPYVKLAASLASVGVALFFLERYGLNEARNLSGGGGMHIDGTVLSIMVIAPFVLIIAAAIVFMVGKIRRL